MRPVSVECPKCFKKYNLPAHLAGFVIECPDCKEKFYLSVIRPQTKEETKAHDKKSGKEKWKFFSSKQKQPEKPTEEEKPKRHISSILKPKPELSEEEKAFEKLIKERTYKYIDMFVQALGIFGAILIAISLFLPAIVISKTETLSLFAASFNLSDLGALLSIISPEKFIFFFIVIIPIGCLISIIVDLKNILTKNAGQVFYRLLLMLVTIGYFAIATILILGGGIKFDDQNPFVKTVVQLNQTGGFASVFKNVFSLGSMILFIGVVILVVINLLDFTMFLRRRKVEG